MFFMAVSVLSLIAAFFFARQVIGSDQGISGDAAACQSGEARRHF
jgi:hypothetical protein